MFKLLKRLFLVSLFAKSRNIDAIIAPMERIVADLKKFHEQSEKEVEDLNIKMNSAMADSDRASKLLGRYEPLVLR